MYGLPPEMSSQYPYFGKGKMTRLNLGAGLDVKPGFVNLDIRPLKGAVQCDVSSSLQMRRFRGCDEICAFDILEHFPREKSREVLRMWVSLLRPSGVIRIRCPDLLHAVKVRLSDEWLELLLYGGQDYKENQHLCGYTMAMLAGLLIDLDLKIVHEEYSDAGNLEIWAEK